MESDISNRLSKFKLKEEEISGVVLEESDVSSSKEECINSLFARVFGSKKANFTGLKTAMNIAWPINTSFGIKELGHNTFQFTFRGEKEKEKVLNGGPWSFDGQYLLLNEWTEDILEQVNKCNKVSLWIQIWNLPLEWMAMETGFKIGKLFGEVNDVLIPESGSNKGRFIKILAAVNLDKPLLRGTHISLGQKSIWVEFKYENLLTFCFYCGHVGHPERLCGKRKQDFSTENLQCGQYGEWLRAGDASSRMNRGKQNFGSKDEGTSNGNIPQIHSLRDSGGSNKKMEQSRTSGVDRTDPLSEVTTRTTHSIVRKEMEILNETGLQIEKINVNPSNAPLICGGTNKENSVPRLEDPQRMENIPFNILDASTQEGTTRRVRKKSQNPLRLEKCKNMQQAEHLSTNVVHCGDKRNINSVEELDEASTTIVKKAKFESFISFINPEVAGADLEWPLVEFELSDSNMRKWGVFVYNCLFDVVRADQWEYILERKIHLGWEKSRGKVGLKQVVRIAPGGEIYSGWGIEAKNRGDNILKSWKASKNGCTARWKLSSS
ncbi:hypothetical protein DH2020_019387 [Rehmannia glutinosa]|uniref:CCHC-type domain-containing protein n=1 Tax=Rehmannia glutinosa TaxID=99300 RepID=A0ABR0WMR5_REHGL